MEDLMFTLNAILPIILLIGLGYFLKRIHFFDLPFVKQINRFCFKVLIPILLFYNVVSIGNLQNVDFMFVLYVSLAILLAFGLGFVVTLLIKDRKQKGVILQGIFRSNYAIIGIPLAMSLGGQMATEVVAIASIVSAFSIPLFNVLAVIALSVYGQNEDGIQVKKILKQIVTNPLIVGVVSGLVVLGIFNLAGVGGNFSLTLLTSKADLSVNNFIIERDLPFLYTALVNVKSLASPLALIALGGQFTFKAVKSLFPQIALGVTVRCIVVPAVFLTIFYLLGYRSLYFPALIGLFATPVAVSSVPMAAEMKQDETLAGQLVVWTSIISAFSLFVIIYICTALSIFPIV